MSKQYKMLNSKTFETDSIAVSSFIYQSAPISIGCAPSLFSIF